MKSRVQQGAELIRGRVACAWDEAQVATVVAGVGPRRRRRRIARATACGVALAALALAHGARDRVIARRSPASTPAAVARAPRIEPLPAPAPPPALRFRDGSRGWAIAAGTVMRALGETAERIDVRVDRGGARFEVTPSTTRTFAVSSGRARVVVVGTVFTVERDGAELRVGVERGKVRVELPASEPRLLTAGQSATFHDEPTDGAPPRAPAPRVRHPGPLAAAPAAALPAANRLMAEADAARAAGHPDEAVRLLDRVVREHAREFDAPLAAFTSGRLYLEQLDRPRVAAERFAQARALAPSTSLAEDALAREVEAWAAAHDVGRAQERAQEYLRRHPDGVRAAKVRRLAGLPDLQ